eukprot:Gregarina_sp_Pseudo_9__5679@NODE_805_length_2195_cov_61_911874_g738_i1_p5_GENE_NODE_805_length_2195_cov_61_911874_g738_i1NODE_805_length_2195_cov_61_911874_g738_i1_p5_ORF_typecomplete_len122_score9_88ATPgrasp_YheCD/PF14398_6/0_21_NODE_805_length_2195_cov_61_911874_g738_i149414
MLAAQTRVQTRAVDHTRRGMLRRVSKVQTHAARRSAAPQPPEVLDAERRHGEQKDVDFAFRAHVGRVQCQGVVTHHVYFVQTALRCVNRTCLQRRRLDQRGLCQQSGTGRWHRTLGIKLQI